MEGTLTEIRLFAGRFAPKNWAWCNGQLVKIDDNTTLFALLGTHYGGDGKTNFNLPNIPELSLPEGRASSNMSSVWKGISRPALIDRIDRLF